MDKHINRENTEWCNLYWENANKSNLPRILLIGDSVAVSYRAYVAEHLADICYVDLLATSKAITDVAFEKELRYVLGEYKYKAIHFNNGLHGNHVATVEYEQGIKKLVDTLKKDSRGALLIWAMSTPIVCAEDNTLIDDERNKMVIDRNNIAKCIMRKNDISINNLYDLVYGKSEIRSQDPYHFNENGQKLQGNAVARIIQELL